MDQRLHQAPFGLGELRAVAGVDGDVAERRRAVVLNVDICGGEELDKNRDCAGIDELLAVVIYTIVNTLVLSSPQQT